MAAWKELKADIRWLNSWLGPARDWDVFIEEGLIPLQAYFPKQPELLALRQQAEEVRQGHYKVLQACLEESRYHRLMLKLHGWRESRAWRKYLNRDQRTAFSQPTMEFAGRLLKQHHRRVVKQGINFAHLSVEKRHRLRIRIKELRYGLEFFAGIYDQKLVAAYRKNASDLQDCLGVLNDIAVAERLLDEIHVATDSPVYSLIKGWYAHRQASQEQDFASAWQRFQGCKQPWVADG